MAMAMKRPSFGTVEWCTVSPLSPATSVSSVNPLAQTQAGSFFDVTRSSISSRLTPSSGATATLSWPTGSRGSSSMNASRPLSAQESRSTVTSGTRRSALRGSTVASRIFAIPGYTGHIPNKDIEVCGGTFTVESMAAAAIRSRRLRDETKLVDGRTHSPRFAAQLGAHSELLRSYKPWARQAAGVSHSFERYSSAARPACFAR
eukprot:s3662_g2.t1